MILLELAGHKHPRGDLKMSTDKHEESHRLVNAYNEVIDQLHKMVDKAEKQVKPKIINALDNLDEQAEHLSNLTREEIDLISAYIVRDLHDAAEFVETNSAEFKDWMNLQVDLVEDKLLDSFPVLIDETRLALEELKERADRLGEWRAGEVVAPGVFKCKQCGKRLDLHNTAQIPPCAGCKGTVYRRVYR